MITKDMFIADIIANKPGAIDIFTSCGMGYVTTPAAQQRKLAESCKAYGVDVEEVLANLNS